MNKSPSCPEYMLNFDVTKYPLLNEVWEILEEINNSKDRVAIYSKYHGIPTKKYFIIKLVRAAETDLEILLDTMYEIDNQKESATGLLSTFDAIKRMPGGEHVYWDDVENAMEIEYENFGKSQYKYREIRKLKAEFSSHIERIQKQREVNPLPLSGDFEIISGNDLRMHFRDFYSFREELLVRTRQELSLGEIPFFHYVCNFKEDRESDIGTLAFSITRFLENYSFPVKDFGLLLWKLFEQGFNIQFNRNFQQHYLTAVMKQEAFTHRPGKLRSEAKSAAIELKKELLKKNSSRDANAIVRNAFDVQDGRDEYKKYWEIVKKFNNEAWKKFLQIKTTGNAR